MKTIRIISACLIVALAGITLNVQGAENVSLKANAAGTVVAYTQIPGDAVSSLYTMNVNGTSIAVNFDGADYTRFAMSGPVTVEITASSPVLSAKVFPTAFGIVTAINNDKITFTLDQPRYFRLDVEGKKPLYFFADPLEVKPPKLGDANVKNIMDWPVDNTGATIETTNIQAAIDWVEANHATKNVLYFPNGKYKVGQLNIKSNVTIYIADGALLKCTGNQADYPTVGLPSTMKAFRSQISGKNVGNFKIIGRGIIDGGRNSGYQPHDLLIMAFQNCTKFTVEGLMLRQSDFWHITSMYGNDKIFRNLKLFTPGIKKLNADGINPISCHNVLIDNCFHIGDDDSFSVGVDDPYPDGVHDITIQNCVACPTRQNSFRISCVMAGPCYNIVFKDCYSIGGEGAISAGVYPWGATFGEVYNCKWENVHSDIPNFISFDMITNSGNRHDFDIINCTTSGSRGGIIKGRNSSSKYYNIRFHNLKVNGKYCHNLTDANILTNEFAHDISFTVDAPPTPISVNGETPRSK